MSISNLVITSCKRTHLKLKDLMAMKLINISVTQGTWSIPLMVMHESSRRNTVSQKLLKATGVRVVPGLSYKKFTAGEYKSTYYAC